MSFTIVAYKNKSIFSFQIEYSILLFENEGKTEKSMVITLNPCQNILSLKNKFKIFVSVFTLVLVRSIKVFTRFTEFFLLGY